MAEVSQSHNFTGDWVRFNVPNNVTKVKIAMKGGDGGGGAIAGWVGGEVRVKDTDTLWLQVGRGGFAHSGRNGGSQCYPNGGGGGNGAGGGGGTRQGGDGGGGASTIRLGSRDGDLVAVAGGGGGNAGDGSQGGQGGAARGANGSRGDGSGNTATGGDQNSGGKGGKTSAGAGSGLWGDDAPDAKFGRAGAGGTGGNDKCVGGGGGGGGYYSGGGGQAGLSGSHWAGGGGGGSNYVEGLIADSRDSRRGLAGGPHDGLIVLSWQEGGDYPPSTPTSPKINGADLADDMITRSQSVTISAVPDDPTKNQDVRIVVVLSRTNYNGGTWATDGANPIVLVGTWDQQNKRDFVDVAGLQPNTRYDVRIFSQDKRGQRSNSYVGGSFWTNRAPDKPVNVLPAPDTEIEQPGNITFTWTYSDPDVLGGADTQSKYQWRWRALGVTDDSRSQWITSGVIASADGGFTISSSGFTPNRYYGWSVRVADLGGLWSEWSDETTVTFSAQAVPPDTIYPKGGVGVYTDEVAPFAWRFRTVNAGEVQVRADLRYRMVGTTDWTTLTGDTVTPGDSGTWDIPANTFEPGVHYEWSMRTLGSVADEVSEWTVDGTNHFYAVGRPGVTVIIPEPTDKTFENLGVGVNRAYLYRRGGEVLVGEITPMVDIQWGRQRDDISSCTIHVNQYDSQQKTMLTQMQTWKHEIVVFRDGVRVWEGPVVRISNNEAGWLEIEAKDVMGYVYRRILRHGYNDSYQVVYGQQLGLKTVVHRAERIILNALVYDDPNVLEFLTPLHNYGDAIQSRVVKAFSKTAWEEVDDMAATAGLDYAVAGRRIILNDTHRPIGRLPELGNGDFSDRPVITEYGMAAANVFGVTNGSGVYGVATRPVGEEGYLEQLATAYGESQNDADTGVDLTAEQIAALVATYTAQAERNIANRYPVPEVVRIPDNSQLLPTAPVGINQLVPGVWIPLRAQNTIRQMAQWQKLDSISVRQESNGEKITVVMSPAPNGGEDPDADIFAEESA